MKEKQLYNELITLTKNKERWRENICYVESLLDYSSLKITSKALWLLGEMGLQDQKEIVPYVAKIASFMDNAQNLLRERALNALGRIGRANFENIKPYFEKILTLSTDEHPRVRLAFIWASENIATNTPDLYDNHLSLFINLLHDSDEKVRIEAPEMFRVVGKRRPQIVKPYLDKLQWLAENDENQIVRIHSAGAIRITQKALSYY